MFWISLAVLVVFIIPLNLVFINLWYMMFPPVDFSRFTETNTPRSFIIKAHVIAFVLFGIIQTAMVSLPLIYSDKWYNYIICGAANMVFASSGKTRFYLDKVRSSHVMRIMILVFFLVFCVEILPMLKPLIMKS